MSEAREVGAGRFERKPMAVEAIRWVGEENCQEVFDWLGLEHPEDETDHSVIYVPVFDNGVLETSFDPEEHSVVELVQGCWLARDGEGKVRAYSDGMFRAEFERVSEDG